MKGLSKYLSYALTIMFGFAVLAFFTSTIYSFYDQVLSSNIETGLKQITVQTANGIIYLYDLSKESTASPRNSSSVVIADMNLNYPDKISGRNYEVKLLTSTGIWSMITEFTTEGQNITIKKETTSNPKIIASTTQRPFVSYEYDLPNVPILLRGKFHAGVNDTLKLVRYNYNGTLNDVVILGEPELIIAITEIK